MCGVQLRVTCQCPGGRRGSLCEQDAAGCQTDAEGDCCPAGRALDAAGTCCDTDEALDSEGRCCPTQDLDACGVCGGAGVFRDSMGTCCPTRVADANGACCFGAVDACGAVPALQRGIKTAQSCA